MGDYGVLGSSEVGTTGKREDRPQSGQDGEARSLRPVSAVERLATRGHENISD